MGKKRYKAEQIIAMLREAEVEIAQGRTIPWVCKKLEVSEQMYYCWRKEHGGLIYRRPPYKRMLGLVLASIIEYPVSLHYEVSA